jgi:4-amino-4-deoxy-L-arabinose transferase-like glycosyltransferase
LYSFSNKERWALAGILVLLIPALLVNLGIVPLYVEEPRRAVIALEMLMRGNWLVPTINGEYYYLKPPFFNWILAVVYWISGVPSEFVTRIPTVVSLLLFGWLIFWTGKKYVSTSFGALSSLLFLTASGNLFFNALLAEIDIFYSLVTFAGLISLFHFHRRRKYGLMFLAVYFLGAVGTLTKGLPSLVFTGLSVLAYFLVIKEFKKLFSWQHFAGIFLYILIVGGYFLVYNSQGDALQYLLSLSFESGKRLSGDTFRVYLEHIVLYPLDTLMNLLPASLLIIFIFRKSFLHDIRSNTFMKFALLMLVVHFPIYWLPPGGRQRYIIMLYPFMIQVFTYFFLLYFKNEDKKSGILARIIAVAIGLGAAGSLVPLFVSSMSFISMLVPVCIFTFLILTGMFLFQLKKPEYSILTMILAVVVLRLFFGFTVLPVRATQGAAPANRQAALDISAIVKNDEVCILQPTYLPMQTIFYFEREKNKILPVCHKAQPGRFLILEKIFLEDYSFYRETKTLDSNPLHPFSDPFSRDDQEFLSGYNFKICKDFRLQKRSYYLLGMNND